MKILPYRLDTTNDCLTSRAGLLGVAQLMRDLRLAERIDQSFPGPGSNRGYPPSAMIETLMLMQHEGRFHLDEVRHIQADRALRQVLGLARLPQATTLGDWLRRMGTHAGVDAAWVAVNRALLQAALHRRREVTLDIDATAIESAKRGAQWTYRQHQGYMPMVGHIAEVGQVVAVDFRAGHVPPNKDNLAFIQQCEQSLPAGCRVHRLRIDAAGYQTGIIEYCDQADIEYAIRARTSPAMRAEIDAADASKWQPLIDRQGQPVEGQDTYRTACCIGDYEQAFTLVIQRQIIRGQARLDLETDEDEETLTAGQYRYRAIATNRKDLSDSELIHWYHQRAEDSENRIKELKRDLGADTLPCSDHSANALYFRITALSYNLLALMRQLLPEDWAHHRASTLRWRVYAMAAKVVRTGRQTIVKLRRDHRDVLRQVLQALRAFDPPPI